MRGFSDEERAQIRADLISTGREQFLQYGPERTRVKDVTDPAGIAKPTFYQFFDSKGELYLEIIARETEELADRMHAELKAVEDTQEGLERIFTIYVEFIEDNPDLQQVLSDNPSRELFRNVPQEKIDEVQRQWTDAYIPIIEDLQKSCDGALATYNPSTILGLLRPIGLMEMYKEKETTRSEENFEQIQNAHIETLVRGLILNDKNQPENE